MFRACAAQPKADKPVGDARGFRQPTRLPHRARRRELQPLGLRLPPPIAAHWRRDLIAVDQRALMAAVEMRHRDGGSRSDQGGDTKHQRERAGAESNIAEP